jgi:hypothetical protein
MSKIKKKAKSTKTAAKKSKKALSKTPTWKVNPFPTETPKQYINSVAISGDGSKVFAGTYYHNYSSHVVASITPFNVGVFAWSKSKTLLWKDVFSSTDGVYWVACSRDGAWAASGGLLSYKKGFIKAYNTSSGSTNLLYNPKERTNMVALNQDGTYLVAGADSLYLFTRTGTTWTAVPKILPIASDDSVISVGISGDGKWIVAGTFKGQVILVQNNAGSFGASTVWQFPAGGTIHWIAISADGTSFAVAGSGKTVFFFTVANFPGAKKPDWSLGLTGCSGLRSVALTDNGSLLSVVANNGDTGMVFQVANKGVSGKQNWSMALLHSPNSTSMDSTGQYVTAADGHPDLTPGQFYLYGSDGTLKWQEPTSNMSWPMQIAAGGSGIAAGSDDSNVYYFSN